MADVTISSILERCVDVVSGHGDAEIQLALKPSDCRFALVHGQEAGHGVEIRGIVGRSPDGTLSRLGPVVTIDAEPDVLEPDTLLELALAVTHSGAVGALVLSDSGPVGVVARDALIQAIPLELLTANRERQGTPDIPSLRYQCTQCDPPTIRLLRAVQPDDQPPRCVGNFFHGPMERAAP
ncbi:hypothetical protein SGFS_014920 [Streptomyces graminofaciens]|uniref:CBS domain-containing protein n=1 Tax=Streptomyces graminofaciens TaxID=68212 RepID=A0ABM7F324_9ACTN|nr:hypothetical protein [Streptomyces graminofaciens]BBC30198.1 hypothetical protein SGFS_014920 [Streptomyces graminofaciens]